MSYFGDCGLLTGTDVPMRIKFQGAEADGHRLEAYEGLKSLDGLVRVATIATHYAATGEVRFRAPYSHLLETQLTTIRNGSLEFMFEQASRFVDQIQGALARTKADAIISRLLARGTGQAFEEDLRVDGHVIPPGDIDAMLEAAEAAIKGAHRWIDTNQKSISMIDGDNEVVIDIGTKEYVDTEITGIQVSQDVSVAALNVNNKTGRVYLFDIERTVPFAIGRDAAPRTLANLSTYLGRYARNTGETVNIQFLPISTVDGRLKRIVIFDCYDIRDAA